MKRVLHLAVCITLILVMLSANLCTVSYAAGFYSKVDMVKVIDHIEKYADLGIYAPVQGACSDGDHAYFALVQGGVCHVVKFDVKTWKYVESKPIVNMGHSNDITYNSDKDYLVVANNAPYYDVVTLIDPDTLVPIKDVKLKQKIYSIAYNAKRGNYVVGLSGTYDFALLDSDFKLVKKFKGMNTGYTRQGGDCDDDYIYFVQSGGKNVLVIYDYSGAFIAQIPMTSTKEAENIFHIGNSFYTSLYYHGCYLHRIGFSDATKISYNVSYDANGGAGNMADTTVTYGKKTKLRACTFTRDDYLFAGWRVQRTSDKKYVGYRNGSSKYEWLDQDDVFNYRLYDDQAQVAKTVKFGGVKLYASWVSKEYQVDFDCGEGIGDPMTAVVERGEAYPLPDGGYTREDYIFDGYKAVRDADNRVYGYRAKSKKPEWLHAADVKTAYRFRPGDVVTDLTPEGTVTMTAQYQYAYTFSEDGSTLRSYIGVDEKVHIPDRDGTLSTLAQGAFDHNENMKELYVPSGVKTIQKQAITGDSKLRSIFFYDALPEEMDRNCIVTDTAPIVYVVRDEHVYCIGFFGGPHTLDLLRCRDDALQRQGKPINRGSFS